MLKFVWQTKKCPIGKPRSAFSLKYVIHKSQIQCYIEQKYNKNKKNCLNNNPFALRNITYKLYISALEYAPRDLKRYDNGRKFDVFIVPKLSKTILP